MAKIHSPIRLGIVLELRGVINSHPNWTKEQIFFEMIRYRNDPSQGISIQEVALAFYPNSVIPPKKKGEIPTPTHEAIVSAHSIVRRFRKWFKNTAIVPHAIRNSSGQSLLYNFQTKKEYEDRRKRNMKVRNGIEMVEQKMLGILSKRHISRDKLAEQIASAIEQSVLERKRRRKEIEVTQ